MQIYLCPTPKGKKTELLEKWKSNEVWSKRQRFLWDMLVKTKKRTRLDCR